MWQKQGDKPNICGTSLKMRTEGRTCVYFLDDPLALLKCLQRSGSDISREVSSFILHPNKIITQYDASRFKACLRRISGRECVVGAADSGDVGK
jgi:hypothetical protein